MTTETTNTASGAAEQTAPVTTENQDVVDLEATDDAGGESLESTDATPVEKTAEQKELERVRRQLTKRDRTQGKLHQELQTERAAREALEARLHELESQQDDDPGPPAKERRTQQDPNELDALVNTRAKEIARVQSLNQKANAIYEGGKAKFPDFDQAVKSLNEEVPLFDDRGPTDLMKAVFDSDMQSEVLHYLGTNPDIAAGLEGLSSTQITRRLVRIESDIKEAAKPKTSAAPKPLTPVNAAKATSVPDPTKDPHAWIKWRNEQTAKR